jgi:hypothetical protein
VIPWKIRGESKLAKYIKRLRSLHTGEVAGSIPAAPTIVPIQLGIAANTRNPSSAFSASSRPANLAKPVTHTPWRDPQASSANHPLLREKP